jgi:hypothetical protein
MIKIIGQVGSPEYQAAERFKQFFETLWPEICDTPIEQDNVIIRAGAYISGQKRKDLDLVIAAQFKSSRRFNPRKAIRDTDDQPVRDQPIYIKNFVVVGEVKAHSGSRIKTVGDEIFVKYKDKKWSSASTQNDEQMHSLRNHLNSHNLKPYVLKFVYLSSHNERMGNAVHSMMDPNEVVSIMVANGSVKRLSGKFSFRSADDLTVSNILKLPLFKEFISSDLDRTRIEMFAKKSPVIDQILTTENGKLLQIRGVGGTGKTVNMLSAASRAFNKAGERSLLLTFNRALASDLQRLMAIKNVKSDDENGGIKIETSMTFFYKLARSFGILEKEYEGELDDGSYNLVMELLKEELKAGKLSFEDLKSKFPLDFAFDRIFVDEAQDWHVDEAEILKLIYQSEPICVADGRQQLVRSQRRTDWFLGTSRERRDFLELKMCLRMKNNLYDFLIGLAGRLKREWDCERNNQVSGGRIFMINSPYELNENLHAQLIKESEIQNIKNIDWLFLVPPPRVLNAENKTTKISDFLRSRENHVIDLVEPKFRDHFSNNSDDFRVLQYESCRGLEGWNLILDSFDTFLEMKLQSYLEGKYRFELQIEDYESEAIEFVWNWMSMVISRAMDTIVIHVENPRSQIGQILSDQCRVMHDFVEIRRSDSS